MSWRQKALPRGYNAVMLNYKLFSGGTTQLLSLKKNLWGSQAGPCIHVWKREGESTHWLYKSYLAELVGFEVTDYLAPSGAKHSESLGSKTLPGGVVLCSWAPRQPPAGTERVWGGMGKQANGRSGRDTRGVTKSCGQWAGQFYLAISPLCLGDEKITENENKTWITVTSKKTDGIVVVSFLQWRMSYVTPLHTLQSTRWPQSSW